MHNVPPSPLATLSVSDLLLCKRETGDHKTDYMCIKVNSHTADVGTERETN